MTGELILETAESMDTEEIADLLEDAHAEEPDMSMSDESFGGRGADQSHEEGSEEEGLESDEGVSDEEDSLSEDRYNSAGEEVSLGWIDREAVTVPI